jgi:S-DNA-T family DNA segregation ATPase FtsK/SpoIIIE
MSPPAKRDIKYEILGLSLVALALLAMAGFLTPAVGKFGHFISRVLEVTAGKGKFIIPFFLGFAGIHLLVKRSFNPSSKGTGIIIIFITFLTYLHLGFTPDNTFGAARAGLGGGFIGALPAYLLMPYFGTIGTKIILATFFLVGITLLTGLSVVELTRSLTSKLSSGLVISYRWLVNYIFPEQEEPEKKETKSKKRLSGEKKNRNKNKNKRKPVKEPDNNQTDREQDPQTAKTNFGLVDEEQVTNDEEITSFSPAMDRQGAFRLPSPEMLKPAPPKGNKIDQNIKERSQLLEQILNNFGIKATVINVSAGPAITRYEIQPPPGIKVSRIAGLADDIALGLAASGVRIEAPIPGKAAVGIEVPNPEINSVQLRELLESKEFIKNASKLTVALGKDIAGSPVVADLSRMPHLLVAGATGAGKSVCINTLICSILFKAGPEDVKLLMVDPKMVELANYNGIPHLVSPVVTDPKKAAGALRWAVREMEQRYELFAAAGVRDINRYNQMCRETRQITANKETTTSAKTTETPGTKITQEEGILDKPTPMVDQAKSITNGDIAKGSNNLSTRQTENPYKEEQDHSPSPLPYIVIIIDELADLMMVAPADVEDAICRLAQMARACGIHLVIATQRPSVDVITGLIKANIPSRISFAVSSQTDSRTILDMGGAEKLLGKGDMLFYPVGAPKPMRVQGAFLSDNEVESVVEFLKEQANPVYNEEVLQQPDNNAGDSNEDWDDLLPQAAQIFIENGTASISMLQRRLHIGYARAARLVDIMERRGIVGGYEGSKPRQVLMTWEQYLQVFGEEKQAQAN